MKRLVAAVGRLLRDVLFVRVCTAIYGIGFAALGIIALAHFRPQRPAEWGLVALLAAIAGLGLFMSYAAFFGRRQLVERAADGMSDGGELLGIVVALAVVCVALPVTALLRTLHRATR